MNKILVVYVPTYKVYSEIFHGSARAIIRSLESRLALISLKGVRAIARLKRDGLVT